jgi:lipopolysaccharide heptosyltransferase I
MVKSPKKILIIKPSALGDIIHSLPVLALLAEKFPEAEIHWVVAKGLHTVFENHPMISKLWIIDKNRWKKLEAVKETFQEISALRRNLKAEKFDCVIDLQGLFRTGLIAKFTGSKCRIGFKKAREGAPMFYTDKIDVEWEGIHAVDRYLKLLEPLGCTPDKVKFLFAPFEENISILKELPSEFAVIAPSAGKAANRWPAERFGELASRLDLPSIIVSNQADAKIAEKVVAASDGKAISIAGRTSIMELVAVIKKSKFFISNDTGPMHIAAALKIPVFAIFGPANPIRTGPYGDIHTIIRKELPCSPCYAKKKCKTWECLGDLTVDMVYNTIIQKIKIGDTPR